MTHPRSFIPDARGWASIGMFALVVYVVTLIALKPELQHNDLFKMVAVQVIGTGGFGLLCAWLWGGSKVSSIAGERMAMAHFPASQAVTAPADATLNATVTHPEATP